MLGGVHFVNGIPSIPAQVLALPSRCIHPHHLQLLFSLAWSEGPVLTWLAVWLRVPVQSERVPQVVRLAPDSLKGTPLDQTLLCFVFVDPHGKHSFCSRYDFGPWPLLGGVQQLPPRVLQVRLGWRVGLWVGGDRVSVCSLCK